MVELQRRLKARRTLANAYYGMGKWLGAAFSIGQVVKEKQE